jgi:hypothetical protein
MVMVEANLSIANLGVNDFIAGSEMYEDNIYRA